MRNLISGGEHPEGQAVNFWHFLRCSLGREFLADSCGGFSAYVGGWVVGCEGMALMLIRINLNIRRGYLSGI
jgi:hypothetical protein